MSNKNTRQRMVETAVRMFQEHGYHGVSWRKLVQEAGTPWGSIAHHFPGGKVELAQAAIEAGAKAVNNLIHHCFTTEPDAAKAVIAWFRYTAEHMHAVGFQTGCPVASIALSTTPEVPEVSEASYQAFDRWEKTLAELLNTGNATRARVSVIAKITVTLLEGSIVRARIGHSKEPLMIAGQEASYLICREVLGKDQH